MNFSFIDILAVGALLLALSFGIRNNTGSGNSSGSGNSTTTDSKTGGKTSSAKTGWMQRRLRSNPFYGMYRVIKQMGTWNLKNKTIREFIIELPVAVWSLFKLFWSVQDKGWKIVFWIAAVIALMHMSWNLIFGAFLSYIVIMWLSDRSKK